MTAVTTAVSAALAGGALCGIAGALVPAVIARLPEPQPRPESVPQPATGSAPERAGAEPDDGEDPVEVPTTEREKVPYAVLAARPGLALLTAALSAAAGAVLAASLGWSWALLVWLPTVPVAVLLGYVDLRTKLLPTVVLRPATLAAIGLAAVAAGAAGDWHAFVRAVVGMLAARTVFWVLWWIHSAGLGFGDVRLSALLGLDLAFLGWGELVTGTYASFLLFGLPGLLLAVVRRDRSMLRTGYPFGPAMIVGALVGVLAGPATWGHLVG